MKRRQTLQALGALLAVPAWAQDASGRVRVPDVRLLDQDGAAQSLRALCAGPVVIGFFYTGCSTVCPPQTAALRALRDQLNAGAPKGGATGVRVLSITVDPLGDSPDAIRTYAKRFGVRLGLDAGWLMLTGQRADLARVWTAFGVPVDDPDAHSSLLWIGSAASGQWTRAAALTPTARLANLLRSVRT